jgi:hypothetical protein
MLAKKQRRYKKNPISLAHAMPGKVYDEKLKKIIINDNRHKSDRNDVEKNVNPDRFLCGPGSLTKSDS